MQDMRSIIAVLKETIAALTDELTQVREQTIADEITAPDRRKMTADVRLIPAILSAWTISKARAVADQDEITYLLSCATPPRAGCEA